MTYPIVGSEYALNILLVELFVTSMKNSGTREEVLLDQEKSVLVGFCIMTGG